MAACRPELGDAGAIQVFLLYKNHSKFSWYIRQCPLLGRGPLLGASVNGELTVIMFTLFTINNGLHGLLITGMLSLTNSEPIKDIIVMRMAEFQTTAQDNSLKLKL